MKLFPDTWWLARPALLRKIIKTALALLALYAAVQFLGFSFHSEGSLTREHSFVRIGTPEPWYHWEKTTEQVVGKTSSSSSMHMDSGMNLFTRSFGAGIVSLLIIMLLCRISSCEKTSD